jgi:hypothetical protein
VSWVRRPAVRPGADEVGMTRRGRMQSSKGKGVGLARGRYQACAELVFEAEARA